MDDLLRRRAPPRAVALSAVPHCRPVAGGATSGKDALLTVVRARPSLDRMTEPIRVARGVQVPAAALEWRAVRSSGPGGQNVNKVSSKVELRVDLAQVTGLDGATRARLRA